MSIGPGTSSTDLYALRPSISGSFGLIGTTVCPCATNARTARLPNLRRSRDAPTTATTLGIRFWRVCPDELQNAAAAFLQVLHRRGVRNANEAWRVERFAGRHRHARLLQECVREIEGRPKPIRRKHLADIDEHVERAGGFAAPQPRVRAEPRVELIAALPVFVEHGFY